MGFFSTSSGHSLPPEIVPMMERCGYHDWYFAAGAFHDAMHGRNEVDAQMYAETELPLQPFATADPDGFVDALAEACIPTRNWAVWGAARTVTDLVSLHPTASRWPELLDAACDFLRTYLCPPERVPGFVWDHWLSRGGDNTNWVPRRQPPAPGTASITPLQPNESRRLVQLDTHRDDGNVILARRGSDEFIGIVNARYNNDDPTRSEWTAYHAPDLEDLYRQIGGMVQDWTWADPEFEPFISFPRPLI
ncbi:MAG: hypothetical protein ACOYOQ_15770 [Microthrixaceae bacterium]